MAVAVEALPRIGGLVVERRYTRGTHPYEGINWVKRDAQITDSNANVIFEQKGVEVPDFWSQLAINIVVSKYFRGKLNTSARETSVKQMIDRVVNTVSGWGIQGQYFASEEDAETFRHELAFLLVNQHASFNSPVWFNVGFEPEPQCSACFILSIEDSMESIIDWWGSEALIFKGGSGSGINLSNLRSSREQLSAGGFASGPLSFMRGADSIAGSIKSGGKTRRAAKMVVLNVNHPDILDFIGCKANEERKAYALGAMGYDMNLNGEAWGTIQYQNANNSVRVTSEFIQAVEEDKTFTTRFILTGEPCEELRAREILDRIAQATWECGDPGMQYDTTINDWHTCPNSGRINASNPCSEYMHLDDSACNLASINLLKYQDSQHHFDHEAFAHTVDILITAQEILVDYASYPTAKITRNAKAFRQLGLGYANLGALLMASGIAYDSEAGRNYAAAITSLLTGRAYRQSAVIAQHQRSFEGFAENRQPMLRVIEKHREAAYRLNRDGITPKGLPEPLLLAAQQSWDEATDLGLKHGYRNSQATVIAPTGTIAFMMDCDTTGIEPDIALVKYKRLVGGGLMKIVNTTVPRALRSLKSYSDDQIAAIVAYIDQRGTIEGAPHLREEHLPIFDCAFRPENGNRSIHHLGHIKMMGAVQPFVSGAISKTVNLPNEATVTEIADAYLEGARQGLKAIAIYRDGSKKTQPLSTSKGSDSQTVAIQPVRRRLADERAAITHKFSVAGHEGYITAGLYEDGTPGEIFITMHKQGSTISGLMDCFATSISIALQYGVPVEVLVRKFIHTRFEPAGYTGNPAIPVAKSIMDYIFRWLAVKFLPNKEELTAETVEDEPINHLIHEPVSAIPTKERIPDTFASSHDAPPCTNCGAIMVRAGACYACASCGETSGCG